MERVWSSAPRTPEEMHVLKQIYGLAPGRKYYPEHLKSMEQVSWRKPGLSCPELDLLALKARYLVDESGFVAFLHPVQAASHHQVKGFGGEAAPSMKNDLHRDSCVRNLSLGRGELDAIAGPCPVAARFEVVFDEAVAQFVHACALIVRSRAANETIRKVSFGQAMHQLWLTGPELTPDTDVDLHASAWPDFSKTWRLLYSMAKRADSSLARELALSKLVAIVAGRQHHQDWRVVEVLVHALVKPEGFPSEPPPYVEDEAFAIGTDFDKPRLSLFAMLPEIFWYDGSYARHEYDWAPYWLEAYRAWDQGFPRPAWKGINSGQNSNTHEGAVTSVLNKTEKLWAHRRMISVFFCDVQGALARLV
jgi:hypothetical protein